MKDEFVREKEYSDQTSFKDEFGSQYSNVNESINEHNYQKEFGDTELEEIVVRKAKKANIQKEDIMKAIKAINITAITTGATVVAVGSVMILNNDREKAKKIDIDIVDTDENSIYYSVSVDDLENLTLKIYNDEYSYEISLGSGINEGEFVDLESNTEYTVAVCDKKEIKKVNAKTRKVPKNHTDIGDVKVKYECKCNLDGTFHFIIEYEDRDGAYTNFEAYLIDCNENEEYCRFIRPYNSMQKIDVTNIIGGEKLVKFVVTCTYEGEKRTLIDTWVEI